MLSSVTPVAISNVARRQREGTSVLGQSDRKAGSEEFVKTRASRGTFRFSELEGLKSKFKAFKFSLGDSSKNPVDSVYRQAMGSIKLLGDNFFLFYYDTFPQYGTGLNWSQDVSGLTERLNEAISKIRGILRWTEKVVAEQFPGASPNMFLKAGFEKALENQKKMDLFPKYPNVWMENNRMIRSLGEIYFAASTAVDLYDAFPQ